MASSSDTDAGPPAADSAASPPAAAPAASAEPTLADVTAAARAMPIPLSASDTVKPDAGELLHTFQAGLSAAMTTSRTSLMGKTMLPPKYLGPLRSSFDFLLSNSVQRGAEFSDGTTAHANWQVQESVAAHTRHFEEQVLTLQEQLARETAALRADLEGRHQMQADTLKAAHAEEAAELRRKLKESLAEAKKLSRTLDQANIYHDGSEYDGGGGGGGSGGGGGGGGGGGSSSSSLHSRQENEKVKAEVKSVRAQLTKAELALKVEQDRGEKAAAAAAKWRDSWDADLADVLGSATPTMPTAPSAVGAPIPVQSVHSDAPLKPWRRVRAMMQVLDACTIAASTMEHANEEEKAAAKREEAAAAQRPWRPQRHTRCADPTAEPVRARRAPLKSPPRARAAGGGSASSRPRSS